MNQNQKPIQQRLPSILWFRLWGLFGLHYLMITPAYKREGWQNYPLKRLISAILISLFLTYAILILGNGYIHPSYGEMYRNGLIDDMQQYNAFFHIGYFANVNDLEDETYVKIETIMKWWSWVELIGKACILRCGYLALTLFYVLANELASKPMTEAAKT